MQGSKKNIRIITILAYLSLRFYSITYIYARSSHEYQDPELACLVSLIFLYNPAFSAHKGVELQFLYVFPKKKLRSIIFLENGTEKDVNLEDRKPNQKVSHLCKTPNRAIEENTRTLCVLCDVQIGLIVFSSSGKLFEYCSETTR